MMNYSLLIVDDDILLTEKLRKTIHWKKIGIENVFCANSINKAKEFLNSVNIDLLLCDIEMPSGNGFELLEYIRQENLSIECVFLSSYANFAYAQNAIRFASADYLLKPISNEDLENALLRVIKNLEKQNDAHLTASGSQNNFWEHALKNDANFENYSEVLNSFGFSSDDSLTFLQINFLASEREEWPNRVPIYQSVIREALSDLFAPAKILALTMKRDLAWLCAVRNTQRIITYNEIAGLSKRLISESGCENVEIFWGAMTNMRDFADALKRFEAFERTAVLDYENIVLESRLAHNPEKETDFPWEDWQRKLVSMSSLANLAHEINAEVRIRNERFYWTRKRLSQFIHEFCFIIEGYARSQDIAFSELFNQELLDEAVDHAKRSLYGFEHLTTWMLEIIQGYRATRSNSIEIVKQYISSHLGEDLSRKLLADQVYMSEDYLSKLFVKNTGMSLPSYITRCRMETAKKYLDFTDLKISKIALTVGYSNFSYFSKTFKEIYGCTPNEYRFKDSPRCSEK